MIKKLLPTILSLLIAAPVFGAELLIYDKEHWMDKLSPTEVSKLTPHDKVGYDARYQKGDVVEIRPDGFWTGPTARGFNQDAFRVIALPGVSVKSVEKYTETQTDPTIDGEAFILKKKRRYNIQDGLSQKISTKSLQNITITDKASIVVGP